MRLVVYHELIEASVVQEAFRVPLNYTDLTYQDVKDVGRFKDSSDAVYNPALFKQLDLYRFALDRRYFALLDALDSKPQLKIRKLLARFDATLSKYLNKNYIELYSYLEILYINDDENSVVIEANKEALNTDTYSITRILDKYSSPGSDYNEKFRRELHSIWTILKWRFYRERQLLYPLYKEVVYKNKRPKWRQHRFK